MNTPRFHKDKEEARGALNQFFGAETTDRWRMRRSLGNGISLSVGVIEAIEMLGGKYQAGWGITKFPEEW